MSATPIPNKPRRILTENGGSLKFSHPSAPALPEVRPHARVDRPRGDAVSAPVTAEELDSIAAEVAACASGDSHAYELAKVRLAIAAPRLARDLTAERAEIQAMADMLDEAGIGRRDGDTVRSRLVRMIADANTEAERTEQAEADRDALAAKIETMLRDEEDARRLRLAEHAAREDVAGKLASLQAAVRAHEEAITNDGSVVAGLPIDARLWAAAKA